MAMNGFKERLENMVLKWIEAVPFKWRKWVAGGILAVVVAIIVGIVWLICDRVAESREEHRRKMERLEAYHRQSEREWRAEQMRRSDEAFRNEQARKRREREQKRQRDSIEAARREAEKPRYSWTRLEQMIQDLSNEGYSAVMWKVQDESSAWIVLYEKGGRTYIRKVDPEKDTYGPATRLKEYDLGMWHVWGDKSRWYKYTQKNDLIYEVKGVEKERFVDFHIVDLFTPEPVPGDYEDWEDYYMDNEEDLYFYYNGK